MSLLTGVGLLAFDNRILSRPAHQRRVVRAEQHFAEADRRLRLLLPVDAPTFIAQRLHQRLGGLLHIMLQVGIGAQRDLVDGKLAGLGAAQSHEVDQACRLLHLRHVDLGRGGNVLVGALAQDAAHTAGHALYL